MMRVSTAMTLGLLSLCSPALAQQNQGGGLLVGGPGTGQPLAITRGAGVFHGNYCGVGDNGPGLPPTDALDQACMHHDACTPDGGFPSCACNARFLQEVRAVARDRQQRDDLRATAGMVEAAIPVIPCHDD